MDFFEQLKDFLEEHKKINVGFGCFGNYWRKSADS